MSGSGGYSYAVKGNPTDSKANVLANCVGYANGRFAEIIHELTGHNGIQYQLVCNAEQFIERAKNYGLTISSKPTLGGIMVWQKGATLSGNDGAGHVAVVERINSDGSIYLSESGYGASKSFWNSTRTNSNGRWGEGSGYKFRGCIVNPAVKDEPIKKVGTPVERNKCTQQIEVITDTLRARKEPNLKGEVLGYVKQGIYNVKGVKDADGYRWYKAEDFWLANDAEQTWCKYYPVVYVGKPVAKDSHVDQLLIETDTLRARKEPSLKGEILGYCNTGYFNSYEIAEADGYKWYRLGDYWCANNKGETWCKYFPKVEEKYDLTMKKLNRQQRDAMTAWCEAEKVEYNIVEV